MKMEKSSKMTFGEFSLTLQSLFGKWGMGNIDDRDVFIRISYQHYLHINEKDHPVKYLSNPRRYYEVLAIIRNKGKYKDYSDLISGVYENKC